MTPSRATPATSASIESLIRVVRGQKVILDSDLAVIYGVETRALNRAVKRNAERFPRDFMFMLAHQEVTILKYQFGTSSLKHGGRRNLPLAFTEHGAIMVANVLRSRRAVEMSVYVVRAFVRLRETVATNAKLARKLAELERHLKAHDGKIDAIIEAIRELMNPPAPARKQIGFHVQERTARYRATLNNQHRNP